MLLRTAPPQESLAAACRALKNTKPEVAGAPRVTQLVCAVISGLAKAVGTGFCAPAAAIIPDLLPFLSTPREVSSCCCCYVVTVGFIVSVAVTSPGAVVVVVVVDGGGGDVLLLLRLA